MKHIKLFDNFQLSLKFEEVLDELESKPETETKGNRIVFWFNIID